MKKQYFKCTLAVLTAIMTVLTVLILPAGAKSAEFDVQTWDFNGLENIEVTKETTFAQQVSKDGKIKIGACDPNYNHGPLSIKDGKVEMNYTETQSYSEWWYILLQFKLENNLEAGKTYTFSTDFTINASSYPNNFYFFYTKEEEWGDGANNVRPSGANTVVLDENIEAFATKNNYTYTFTPETDLAAGGYLALRFRPTSAIFTTTVSNAKITTTIPPAIDVADEWDFTEFSDVQVAESESFGRQISNDKKIIIGLPDEGYNDSSLSINSGKVNMNLSNKVDYGNNYHYWLMQFKLDADLKAGKTYTFTTDLNITNTGEWPTNFSFFYTKYTQWEDYTSESGAAPNGEDTVVYEHISGGFAGKTNYTHTFTPETDLKAGGYLAIRFSTRGAQFESSISKATLIENNIPDNIKLLKGAQVRYNTPTGLRFITQVNTKTVTDLEEIGATDIKFGTLIVPEDYLTAEGAPEFTKAAFTAAGKSFLDIAYTGNKVAEEGKDYFEMKAAIVKIKSGNYSRNFAARAYVTYTIGGNEYTTYSDYDLTENSRSVKFVASKLIEDTVEFNKLSDEQKNNVQAFAK